jgi:hypothetical protein
MLTIKEQNAIKKLEDFINDLVIFNRFDRQKLESGFEKLVSPEGNLIIKISIIEKS